MQMSTYSLDSTVVFQFKLGFNLLIMWFFPKLIWFFSNVLLSGPGLAFRKAPAASFFGVSLGWLFSFCSSSLNLVCFIKEKIKYRIYNDIPSGFSSAIWKLTLVINSEKEVSDASYFCCSLTQLTKDNFSTKASTGVTLIVMWCS